MKKMKAISTPEVVELTLEPFEGVSLVNASLLYMNKEVRETRLVLRRLFKGRLLNALSRRATLALSAMGGQKTAVFELTRGEMLIDLEKLVFFDGHLSLARQRLDLKGKTPRRRVLKLVSLKGRGLYGLAYRGTCEKKELLPGEEIEVNADHLLACESAEPLKGRLLNDSLYKVLFVDDTDRRIIIRGPGVIYFQTAIAGSNRRR